MQSTMSALVLCRTCGKHIHNIDSINLFNNEDNEILNKIQALTGIWFIDEPDMPNMICARCYFDVNNAMAFRLHCIRTHHDFQLRIHDFDKTNTRLVSVSDEPDPLISHEADNSITDSYDIDDLSEKLSAVSNVFESSLAHAPENPQYYSTTIQVQAVNRTSTTGSGNSNSTQVKTSEGLNKKTRAASTGQSKVYYCDQCGNHFHCLSNLRVHLVRHAGIRHYECAECGHKEYTSYLLKVHIRVQHRGEKPFMCKYCSKAFSSRQTRATHQRTHEDDESKAKRRKFSCSLCTRSFTNKDTLKKHEIVHSGERPFECGTCHVTFNRKSNLITHYRSKLHIQKLGHLPEQFLNQ